MEAVLDNPSITMYIIKETTELHWIKTGYYLELLTSETMKLHGSTKNKITNNENGINVHHLEITEVVLVHFQRGYQLDSRVLYTIVPNKLFGQLLDISPKNFIFLRTFNLEFP